MNSKKLLLGAAVSAALLFAAPMASACALTAWTSTNGTPIAGEPDDATPVSRYAGRCAMQADAVGDYVVDGTPAGEGEYHVRFYYFTGSLSGQRSIFEGRSASGGSNQPILVQHDGTNLTFSTNGSATTRTVAVEDNRWYAIELVWTAGAGTGSLAITVTGAGSATPLNTPAITGVNNGSDTIEEARLGFVAGSGTGTGTFDAFDSRRTTDPDRLCRGDANGDNVPGAQDRIAMTNEILAFGEPVSPGQPDMNEDGLVSPLDRIAITNAILAFQTCDDL